MKKKKTYKFERSSLQFNKKFVQWLNEVRGDTPKNKYIEQMCGYSETVETITDSNNQQCINCNNKNNCVTYKYIGNHHACFAYNKKD